MGEVPDRLYYSVPESRLDEVLRHGVKSQERLRLTPSLALAHAVSATRGAGPARALSVDVRAMERRGFSFERASSSVFTVSHLPPDFVAIPY